MNERAQRRHKQIGLVRIRFGFVLAAVLEPTVQSGCGDILGFEQGYGDPIVCKEDMECAPGESCERFQCVGARCGRNEVRCNGLEAERCDDAGHWMKIERCTASCAMGECVTPRSCRVANTTCAGASCCSATVVDGGHFDLEYHYSTDEAEHEETADVSRSLRSFVLDRFEVTWSRFAEFAFTYGDESTRPTEGAGAHPAFPGSGWNPTWSESLDLVPDSQRALENMLDRAEQPITSPEDDGDIPVRGINWYVAFAFCIWDGGRLPTEAEWAFAAGSAEDERLYPWPPRDRDAPITHQDARYTDAAEMHEGPGPVGEHPSGQGAFGNEDLAGNVAEWTADAYQDRLPETCPGTHAQLDEHECLHQDESTYRVQRGGSYRDGPRELRNSVRGFGVPERTDQPIGFRCARELPRSTPVIKADLRP